MTRNSLHKDTTPGESLIPESIANRIAAGRLTRSLKHIGQARVERDPDFAMALLRDGVDTMLTGDIDAGKSILHDYIKATIGFKQLGEAMSIPSDSLIRMLGPRGNPLARNLFGIIGFLQKQAGARLHVMAGPHLG